jgi:hypothetical protein
MSPRSCAGLPVPQVRHLHAGRSAHAPANRVADKSHDDAKYSRPCTDSGSDHMLEPTRAS